MTTSEEDLDEFIEAVGEPVADDITQAVNEIWMNAETVEDGLLDIRDYLQAQYGEGSTVIIESHPDGIHNFIITHPK